MAFYACDEEDRLVPASAAEKGERYWCLECFAPVKPRRGKDRIPHFSHFRASPQCRLYSKTEDHLRAQLQLQKSFPEGALQMERPFPEIGRIADLCWEERNIVFEIQCSPLDPREAKKRIEDYRSAGYETVWLLDDKRYNRRVLRPAEEFLRSRLCYYVRIKPGLSSDYYDQFEILAAGKRKKKGTRLAVDLQRPLPMPRPVFKEDLFPQQILRLRQNSPLYFYGDRIGKALLAHRIPALLFSMQNWRFLEMRPETEPEKRKPWKEWFCRWIGAPYLALLNKAIQLRK